MSKERLKKIIAKYITTEPPTYSVEKSKKTLLSIGYYKEMMEKGLIEEGDINLVAEVWKELGELSNVLVPDDPRNLISACAIVGFNRGMKGSEVHEKYIDTLGKEADYHNAKIKQKDLNQSNK